MHYTLQSPFFKAESRRRGVKLRIPGRTEEGTPTEISRTCSGLMTALWHVINNHSEMDLF